jgi:hypothetical protein
MTPSADTRAPADASITTLPCSLTYDEASRRVGQLLMTLSKIEFDIGTSLRALIGVTRREGLSSLVDKLSFVHKLDALRHIVQRQFSEQRACIDEFTPIHHLIQRTRVRRNSFVHGRWDSTSNCFELMKPSYNPLTARTETHWSLSDLHDELHQLHTLHEALDTWRNRWAV